MTNGDTKASKRFNAIISIRNRMNFVLRHLLSLFEQYLGREGDGVIIKKGIKGMILYMTNSINELFAVLSEARDDENKALPREVQAFIQMARENKEKIENRVETLQNQARWMEVGTSRDILNAHKAFIELLRVYEDGVDVYVPGCPPRLLLTR